MTITAVVVLGGSTASGKSALATWLAERTGGVVVNADSQQLFRDLPILSARPTDEEARAVEHRLYGILGPREQPTAAAWVALVTPLLQELTAAGRTPILCGGTGLYLKALLHGLIDLPPVPPEIREQVRQLAPGELRHRLLSVDPVMAERLEPGDRQRQARALEVMLATGRSLATFRDAAARPPTLPGRLVGVALLPPAETVAGRVAARLDLMLEQGALAEVTELQACLPGVAALPIAKLHGCRELAAVARGELTLAVAKERIAAQVRQYAKRQRTFFRHQLPELTPMPVLGNDPVLRQNLLLGIAG